MIQAIKLFFGGLPLANIKNYALAGLVIYSCVITLLYRLEITSHRLTVSQYEALSANQKAKNEQEKREREKVTADVVSSYADSINQVKDYYAKNPTIKFNTIRVRDTSCNGMPSERESTEGINTEANGVNQAATTEPTREVQIDFEQASKEIVQCLELINFSKKQDDVK